MGDRRPARGVATVAVAIVLTAVLAGGCTAIPSSGNPQSAAIPQPAAGGFSQGFGLRLQPPQPGWSPTEVVNTFLLASSDAADNYGLARQYLTAAASESWHPGPGVTIMSGAPKEHPIGHGVNGGPGGDRQVVASGQELATLTSSGQYIHAPSGAGAVQEAFTLQPQANGAYKIAILPQANPGKIYGRLLTSDIFRLVYTPRNLYYYGQRNGSLLPDPIFVPVQGASPVSTLVNDLAHDPVGGAALTDFPPGAHLAGIQVFPSPSGGNTAIVNIALPRGASDAPINKMATQLVLTLTNSVFSPALFDAVRIKINGRLWDARGPALTYRTYQNDIPHAHPGMNAYYLTQYGAVRTVSAATGDSTALSGAAGQPSLTQVAVSPLGGQIAGIGGPSGTVYTGKLFPSARSGEPPSAELLRTRIAGGFTALSYDGSGNLWLAGRTDSWTGVWLLLGGHGTPKLVDLPQFIQHSVTGLRVAPDGVRVAMIIGRGASAQLWLASIKHGPTSAAYAIRRPVPLGGQRASGVLTGVRSLTWYDENHILAVTGSGTATRLWEVPTDGESPTTLLPGSGPGFASVTAAGPGNPLYLGFANGTLERASGLYQFLEPISAGHAPAYPG